MGQQPHFERSPRRPTTLFPSGLPKTFSFCSSHRTKWLQQPRCLTSGRWFVIPNNIESTTVCMITVDDEVTLYECFNNTISVLLFIFHHQIQAMDTNFSTSIWATLSPQRLRRERRVHTVATITATLPPLRRHTTHRCNNNSHRQLLQRRHKYSRVALPSTRNWTLLRHAHSMRLDKTLTNHTELNSRRHTEWPPLSSSSSLCVLLKRKANR